VGEPVGDPVGALLTDGDAVGIWDGK